MHTFSNGKSFVIYLSSILRDTIPTQRPSSEIAYRLEKLSSRLHVVEGKLFIKTIKAMDMLRQCVQITEQLQTKIVSHPDSVYLLLTRLEVCVDDLVRKTLEFRVKAG